VDQAFPPSLGLPDLFAMALCHEAIMVGTAALCASKRLSRLGKRCTWRCGPRPSSTLLTPPPAPSTALRHCMCLRRCFA